MPSTINELNIIELLFGVKFNEKLGNQTAAFTSMLLRDISSNVGQNVPLHIESHYRTDGADGVRKPYLYIEFQMHGIISDETGYWTLMNSCYPMISEGREEIPLVVRKQAVNSPGEISWEFNFPEIDICVSIELPVLT